MAASFERAVEFSNVQQHGEISIIYFALILILLLPCLFWCYTLFSVFINHLLCFYISVFWFSSIYCLHVIISIFVVWDTTHQDVRSVHNCLARNFWVFEKFLRTKSFLVKFQTFSLQAFALLLKLIQNFWLCTFGDP